ncbi:MAG: chorismate pyruvate-lyase family protein [Methanobrevibacter sp.]|jgi:chorismate-pyruvate lyase|nr:chorismate pyruvate-lyase family protein [Candidatus Methanovirga basalitermitum]
MTGKKDINIFKKITKLENKGYELSNTQKIILTTDGSVTTILDVLNGEIAIKTIVQRFEKANSKIAKFLDIEENEEVNYRVVLMHKDNKPLIHAVSYIPIKKLENEFREDLIKADTPIGRILRKYNIESRREIENIGIEPKNQELTKLFNSEIELLTREYVIIRDNEKLIWIKETFPLNYFTK